MMTLYNVVKIIKRKSFGNQIGKGFKHHSLQIV